MPSRWRAGDLARFARRSDPQSRIPGGSPIGFDIEDRDDDEERGPLDLGAIGADDELLVLQQ